MEVVGHQTVAQQSKAMGAGMLFDGGQVGLVISVVGEDLLAVVAAVGDVVGQVRDHQPSGAWHRERVTVEGRKVNWLPDGGETREVKGD